MILIQDKLGDGFRELKSIAWNDVPEMPKDAMQRGKIYGVALAKLADQMGLKGDALVDCLPSIIREMQSPPVRREFLAALK